MLHRALVLLLLAPSLTLAAEAPVALVCRGHEPEWNLRIDGGAATLATFDLRGLAQTPLEGRLQETGVRPRWFVYRGRAATWSSDLVAVVTREACVDTMADASEGGGPRDYTARVSLPDGGSRQGCCVIVKSAAVPVAGTPAATEPETPPPPPTTAAESTAGLRAGGEITAVVLSDGRECRHTGKGATLTSRGRRLNFDCGVSDGDRIGLVGPLTLESSGLLVAQRTVVEWRESANPPPPEPAAARVTQITLDDGAVCRHAGPGATVAFEGRRASYTCGMREGDTVALLGELEPTEGGFRIVRARVAHGESGFVLRASEPVLVRGPH